MTERNPEIFRISSSWSHFPARRRTAQERIGEAAGGAAERATGGVERREAGSADEAPQQLGGRTAGQDLRAIAQLDQEAPGVERPQQLDRLKIDDVRAV